MRLLLALSVMTLLGGCLLPAHRPPTPPEVTVTARDGLSVTTKGDASTAPKVDTTVSTTSLPLSLGQELVFDTKAQTYKLTLSKDTTLETKTEAIKVEGPVAFTPPKPPTVEEETGAKRKTWMYGALFIGIAIAIFGLVEHWPTLMIGGGAGAAAAYCGIFIQDNPWIAKVVALAAGVCITGPAIYHLVIKKMEKAPP